MAEHFDRALDAADLIGPVFGALVFIALMSVVPEPTRQRFNAIFVAGAGVAYLNGGLGGWEFVYIAIATLIAYQGLSRYRYTGLAWFFHAGWDAIHHLYASPIWPWMPTSSAGCAVFDTVIGCWFFINAPPVVKLFTPPPIERPDGGLQADIVEDSPRDSSSRRQPKSANRKTLPARRSSLAGPKGLSRCFTHRPNRCRSSSWGRWSCHIRPPESCPRRLPLP
jgi:hypothetical protein